MGVPATRLLRGALLVTALGCLVVAAFGVHLVADDVADHEDEVDGLATVFGVFFAGAGLIGVAVLAVLAWAVPRAPRGIATTALVTGSFTLLLALGLGQPWGSAAVVVAVLGVAQLGSAVAVLRAPARAPTGPAGPHA